MGYKIVWTLEAENDFKRIVEYVIENWFEQSAVKFRNNGFKKLNYLILVPLSIRTIRNQTIRMYNFNNQTFCYLQ